MQFSLIILPLPVVFKRNRELPMIVKASRLLYHEGKRSVCRR